MSACARNLLAAFARSLRIGSQRASLVNIRQVFVRLFPVGAETTHAGFSCSLFFQHFFFYLRPQVLPALWNALQSVASFSARYNHAFPVSMPARYVGTFSLCISSAPLCSGRRPCITQCSAAKTATGARAAKVRGMSVDFLLLLDGVALTDSK